MKNKVQTKHIQIVKDIRSVNEKRSSLSRLGIRISTKIKNDSCSDGYILGKMRDR